MNDYGNIYKIILKYEILVDDSDDCFEIMYLEEYGDELNLFINELINNKVDFEFINGNFRIYFDVDSKFIYYEFILF